MIIMKKNIFFAMILALVSFAMTSCGDKESEGLSRFTYYPVLELNGESDMVVNKPMPEENKFIQPVSEPVVIPEEDTRPKVTTAPTYEELEKPKVNIDVDSVVVNNNNNAPANTEDFFDDFFGSEDE